MPDDNFDEEFERVFNELKTLKARCDHLEKELIDSERRALLITGGHGICRVCIVNSAGIIADPPITENETKFHSVNHGQQMPNHASARSWKMVEEMVAEDKKRSGR